MKVTGVDKLLKQFDQFGKEGEKHAAAEVEDAARNISTIAKKLAPANFGKLRQGIDPEKVNKLRWEVVSNAPYSGYMEFGTGQHVQVPAEMQDLANAIRGQKGGNFDDALDSIRDWCRAKGIDERAAYPILMSILKEGLRPRPFLYPAWKQGSATFVKNLQNTFNALSKKFNAQK